MKKLILSIAIGMIALTSNAQWITKSVNNGLDEPYRIAYCVDTRDKAILKLEETGGKIAVYVTGSYFCDEEPTVDIALINGEETNRYHFAAMKSQDSKTVFFIGDILNSDNNDFRSDFKRASYLIIRINESHCESDIYKFMMTGSTKALDFMMKELTKYE
jgi:hypothetical protein